MTIYNKSDNLDINGNHSSMRFYLVIALTIALLLQIVAAKVGGPANVGHHHTTTVASLHSNVGSGSVAGSPPPGPPPSGHPPGPPRTTTASSG